MLIRSGTARRSLPWPTIVRQAGLQRGSSMDDLTSRGSRGIGSQRPFNCPPCGNRQTNDARRKNERPDFRDPGRGVGISLPGSTPDLVERVWVLCLDRKNKLIRAEVVTPPGTASRLCHQEKSSVPQFGTEQPPSF